MPSRDMVVLENTNRMLIRGSGSGALKIGSEVHQSHISILYSDYIKGLEAQCEDRGLCLPLTSLEGEAYSFYMLI
jgi:hypothetical protein